MINSRKLEDLHPTVRDKALKMEKRCEDELGIDLVFTSTYRDDPSQNALYAIGRTVKGSGITAKKPMGNVVTNAKAGYSWHNFRLALDVVAVRHGKPVWGTSGEDGKLWAEIGRIGKECGLEWGGDFKSLKDFPHFQDSKGFTLAQLRSGVTVA
ncbi:MAG: M15 family metallopeptidase [Sulfuricurvum sp.]|uniref:M15 family metallopeptidase n=1 Tax=Sulfuricurvum sp. TaxID=2025608 RepID=UPI00261AF245|nr:M15 family metallopeptidase [Sulfuricurvum sp.]MDD5159702.1 M15 family metallopeptidase [Sulfuricurvum sp.]